MTDPQRPKYTVAPHCNLDELRRKLTYQLPWTLADRLAVWHALTGERITYTRREDKDALP